jgi:nucleoside-diphosphate-sugar epimerase
MQSDMAAVDKAAVEALLAASRGGPQPKTFVYTSGVWVHGATGSRLEDEASVLDPTPAVAWRPAVEQLVLKAPGVNALVLRPGCVYGKGGGLTGMWFGGAVKDKAVKAVGDGTNRWAMVHVDDLADAYLRAVESGLGGLAFDIVDRSRATVREMAEAAARAAGVPGKVDFIPLADAKKSMGAFAEALALDQHIDARRAVRLLGWQPKHGGFADGAETYFAAWRAAQG